MRCDPPFSTAFSTALAAARPLAVAAALLCLAFALPAGAQPSFLLGARLGTADPSGKAYEAVYGDTVSLPGVQLEARWPSWFLRLAASQGTADGELVALSPSGGTFATGEPSEITLTPVHLSVGWHHGGGPWGFFVGGGLTRVEVEEKTDFFSDSASADGFHVLVGGSRAFGRRWEASAEALYWQVSDLFEGGLGEVLGDRDLDALELALALSFRF